MTELGGGGESVGGCSYCCWPQAVSIPFHSIPKPLNGSSELSECKSQSVHTLYSVV